MALGVPPRTGPSVHARAGQETLSTRDKPSSHRRHGRSKSGTSASGTPTPWSPHTTEPPTGQISRRRPLKQRANAPSTIVKQPSEGASSVRPSNAGWLLLPNTQILSKISHLILSRLRSTSAQPKTLACKLFCYKKVWRGCRRSAPVATPHITLQNSILAEWPPDGKRVPQGKVAINSMRPESIPPYEPTSRKSASDPWK